MRKKKLKIVKEKAREQIKLFGRNAEFHPNDITASRIEINGNSEMTVDSCKGVLEYSDELVSLNVPKGTITILGENLNLINFSDNSVIICGKIKDIRFCID